MKGRTMKTAYLVIAKSELAGFVLAADRRYFSKPVAVEVIGETETGLLIVTDHKRGHTYPVEHKNLKSKYHLSNKQLEAAAA